MFINCQNTLGPGCRIIGWAHTEVGKDSGFRLVGQEEFIKNIMSDAGRLDLFSHGPPWPDSEIEEKTLKWRGQTGVGTRSFFDGSTADMAIIAAKKCLEKSKAKPDELDLIIDATNTGPGYPSIADHVKNALGAKSEAACFHMTEACTAGSLAVFNGWSMIKAGLKKVLVVCSEKTTVLAPYDKWLYSNLFGDGAFAVLLFAGETEDFLAFDATCLPQDGKLDLIRKTEDGFVQTGNKVHKFVGIEVVGFLASFLKKAEIKPEEIDHLVPHQPSGKTLDLLEEKVNRALPGLRAKFHRNFEEAGNLSSASTGCLISQSSQMGEIKKSELVVVITFGSGLSIGAYAFHA